MACNLEDLDIELFIGEVQKHPQIWNSALEDYHDRNKKRNAWVIIGRQFCEGFDEMEDKNIICNTLIKKWKNIKDNFMKSLKKTKSGQAADSGRQYIYARQFSFLQQAGATTDTQSSLAVDDEEESLEHDAESTETPTRRLEHKEPPRYDPNRSKMRKCDVETALIEYMKAPIPSSSSTVTIVPEINPDRAFFESLLPSVSVFTEDQKLEFRCEVLNIIKRIRMTQQNTQFNVLQQQSCTRYAPTISPYQPQASPVTAVSYLPQTPSRHLSQLTELRRRPCPTTSSQLSATFSHPFTSGLNRQSASPSDGSVSQDLYQEDSINLFTDSEEV